MKLISESYDYHFMQMAKSASYLSPDKRKVGVVITCNNELVVSDCNRFPSKVERVSELLNYKPLKLKFIIHAEVNAIVNAPTPLNDCTLYLYPLSPCAQCASLIVASGINRVVSLYPSLKYREKYELVLVSNFFKKAGVKLHFVTNKIT